MHIEQQKELSPGHPLLRQSHQHPPWNLFLQICPCRPGLLLLVLLAVLPLVLPARTAWSVLPVAPDLRPLQVLPYRVYFYCAFQLSRVSASPCVRTCELLICGLAGSCVQPVYALRGAVLSVTCLGCPSLWHLLLSLYPCACCS